MNAINTTANDCSDEPKISASERDASSSNPIETPPVMATIIPAQRNVPGASGSGPVIGRRIRTGGCGMFLRGPARLEQNGADADDHVGGGRDLQRGNHAESPAPAKIRPAPRPVTAPRLFTE